MYINRYKNRPHMVFDDVNTSPEQEFELITDLYGVHEYPVRYICAHFIYICKIYKIFVTIITDKMLIQDIKIIYKI